MPDPADPPPQASGDAQVFQADDAGVIADHALPTARPFFASPTQADQRNALSIDVVPMACLNLGDVMFEFDSSIVLPPAGQILAQLPELRRSKPSPNGDLPLVNVFGHADPNGNDDYNKTLSGRRAKSVYALITHQPALWDELYSQPFGGDDWSKKLSLKSQSEALGLPAGTLRQQVFQAMMSAMCPEATDKSEFLGRGADSGGKADYQGCGEFNPLLLLSSEETTKLDKAKRNSLNAVNRRVVVFLYRPEIILDVANWPCPRASEGPAGCRKRFFLDAPQRLTPGPERKRHRTQDDETFGCRFYDRIAGPSPCEQILEVYRIRLFDKQAQPLPDAPFTLKDGRRTVTGRTNAEAFLTVRDIRVPANVHVTWGATDGESESFAMDVHVDIDDGDDAAALRRLHNLGYTGRATQEDDVRAFQQDHAGRFPAMKGDGKLDAATRDALKQVNDECDPSPRKSQEAPSGMGKAQGDKRPAPAAQAGGSPSPSTSSP